MLSSRLRLVSSPPLSALLADRGPRLARPGARRPLGQILVDSGALAPGDLLKALAMQAREAARLGDILLTHAMVSEAQLLAALSQQWRAQLVDLAASRPDARLIDLVGAEYCLQQSLLPLRRVGGATVVATTRPADFARARTHLEQHLGPVLMALTSEASLHMALLGIRQSALNLRAESMVPERESCRGWNTPRLQSIAQRMAIAAVLLAVLAPALLVGLILFWTMLTLVLSSGLKLAAAIAQVRALHRTPAPLAPSGPATIARLPIVSVMVPLFKEGDIAARLVGRLGRLTYPRELLDILLVVEEEDCLTRAALAGVRLPRWMRQVIVPKGPLKTKPRALNFALNFCRGSIIGIYDAEDAPEPDQIHRIVRRFHDRGPEVACLQGVLDFYNPRRNWLSRCFTVEYAAWFRVVLPGLARLGLVIPLGGTTLFFRRPALEALGGWDAHNVTEDADLGLRLARHGYRAELIDTVTEEEANCRTLPWIKQRSRWLKGYAMTYAVHMRDPALLWRQLGPWRFFGVQVLFLGTLSQFLLAPLLWTFWLVSLGIWHPFANVAPPGALLAMGLLFVACEAVNIAVGLVAVAGPKHRFLRIWVPTLILYFPLGALAAYKGIWELLTEPFYWDKTMHGIHDTADPVASEADTLEA